MIRLLFNYLLDNSNPKQNVHNVIKSVHVHVNLLVIEFFQESVTFDPFTSVSVPLPKRTAVDTIITYRSNDKSPTKVCIFHGKQQVDRRLQLI